MKSPYFIAIHATVSFITIILSGVSLGSSNSAKESTSAPDDAILDLNEKFMQTTNEWISVQSEYIRT